MSNLQFDKAYEPHEVEKRWYEFWEKEQLFAARDQSPQASYSIVIPPPNVTGVLHMGHMLNNTIQDILIRKKERNLKLVCRISFRTPVKPTVKLFQD